MDPRRQLIPAVLALLLGGCAVLGPRPAPSVVASLAPLAEASPVADPAGADAAPISPTERPYLEVVAGASASRQTSAARPVSPGAATLAATPPSATGSRLVPLPPAPSPPHGVEAERLVSGESPQHLEGIDRQIGAVQLLAWSPGRVYPVRTAPLRVTTLTLGPGETVTAKAAGDTLRWQIGEAVSGAGAAARTHVMIKPLERGLETNLVLTTDRRVYLIELSSGSAADFDPAVAWDEAAVTGPPSPSEPQGGAVEAGTQTGAPQPGPLAPARTGPAEASGMPVAFRIRPHGRAPDWTPLSVHSDGRRTVLRFPPALDADAAPALFAIGADGRLETLTWRRQGDLWIVDRVLDRAELRLGDRRPRIVRIERLTP